MFLGVWSLVVVGSVCMCLVFSPSVSNLCQAYLSIIRSIMRCMYQYCGSLHRSTECSVAPTYSCSRMNRF